MRSLRVRATERFAQDLEDAARYYLEQSGRGSAMRFLDSYDEFCRLVAELPGYGSPVGDSGLRWRKVGVFIAIYRVAEELGEVQLLRLYYISQNWRTYARALGGEA